MNTIIFDPPFSKDTFISSNKVFWNYSWKENKKSIKKLLIFSAVLLSFGILVRVNNELYNPFTLAGVFLIGLAALIGLLMFFSWRKHDRMIKEVADEYKKMNSKYIFEVSENSLKFLDFQTQLELKWSAFKHYTIYREHIIIIPKYYVVGAFLFDKNNKFESEKCEQVLEILKDKLKYVES